MDKSSEFGSLSLKLDPELDPVAFGLTKVALKIRDLLHLDLSGRCSNAMRSWAERTERRLREDKRRELMSSDMWLCATFGAMTIALAVIGTPLAFIPAAGCAVMCGRMVWSMVRN